MSGPCAWDGGACYSSAAHTVAYVANSFSNSVSVIDTASNTVVATVGVGMNPFEVAITPDAPM
jgi:YVTN family beta-propeller protein